MFERRHYQAIADVINKAHETIDWGECNPDRNIHYHAAVDMVQGLFAAMLGSDNPNFDRPKFNKACRKGETK